MILIRIRSFRNSLITLKKIKTLKKSLFLILKDAKDNRSKKYLLHEKLFLLKNNR